MNCKKILLCIISIMIWMTLPAQNVKTNTGEVFSVRGTVYVKKGKMGKVVSSVRVPGAGVELFENLKSVNEAIERYNALIDAGEAIILPYSTDTNGNFMIENAREGNYILVCQGTDLVKRRVKKNEGNPWYMIFINEGNTGGTSYDMSMALSEVIVQSKKKRLSFGESKRPVDTGEKSVWDIHYYIPKEIIKNSSRLILQAAAVDCQTGDTVTYLKPYVFEGEEYHMLQTRLKAYDYANDPLAKYYNPSVILSPDKDFDYVCHYEYKKPQKEKLYHCASVAALGDYTHMIMYETDEVGSCRARRPWSLLGFNGVMRNLELTRDLYEEQEIQEVEVNQAINFRFKVNTNIFIQDSLNILEKERFTKMLRSWGTTLTSVKIQGSASPDGNLEHNIRLSQQRAEYTISLIRQIYPFVKTGNVTPRVYTWEDVADSLQKKGLNEDAEKLRSLIKSYKGNKRKLDKSVKELTAYEGPITDILNNMRSMTCIYKYKQNRTLSPEEVVDAYLNDSEYKEGGTKQFSNGDYFHLFRYFEDKGNDSELDKLTQRVYKEMIDKHPDDYQCMKFSPYVANRMALLKLKHEEPDTTILMPFIREDVSGVNRVRNEYPKGDLNNPIQWICNRKEIVANQALTYFKLTEISHCNALCDELLPADDKQSEGLRHFSRLETEFFKPNKTEEETDKVRESLYYVMGADIENKAVLETQLLGEIDGVNTISAMETVSYLSDESPKKWYLVALLTAKDAEYDMTHMSLDDGFEQLTEEEENILMLRDNARFNDYLAEKEEHEQLVSQRTDLDKVPGYLVYLQKCFDLEPAYKKIFDQEGYLDDAILRKYPYKKEDTEKYRNMFNYYKTVFNKKAGVQR